MGLPPMNGSGAAPCHRVVVLGASNVRLGFAPLVATARALAGGPVDLLAAMGHGRSYGHWSRVGGRELPGIVQCGLWEALAERPRLPTTALLTDVGNDLLYGDGPERLLEWVGECVARLSDAGADVTLTELPMPSLTRLGPVRYRVFRTIFFPTCPLTLKGVTASAQQVNDGLRKLAHERGLRIVSLESAWYGFDPIHLKRWSYPVAWKKIFGIHSGEDEAFETRALTFAERGRISAARPQHRRVFGNTQRRDQPCVTLDDGVRVSLF